MSMNMLFDFNASGQSGPCVCTGFCVSWEVCKIRKNGRYELLVPAAKSLVRRRDIARGAQKKGSAVGVKRAYVGSAAFSSGRVA